MPTTPNGRSSHIGWTMFVGLPGTSLPVARRSASLQDEKALLSGAPHRSQGDGSVEGDELPVVLHGEGEQEKVGDLTGSVDSRGIRGAIVEQADVVRPELVGTSSRWLPGDAPGPHARALGWDTPDAT